METKHPEMVKPNCTIKTRQDELLDELADGKYVSRSEALRVAIEQLSKSVHSDNKTVQEKLIDRIDDLEAELEDISDQLETQFEPSADGPTEVDSDRDRTSRSRVTTDRSEQRSDGELPTNPVYAHLSKHGEMSESDLADETGFSNLEVHKALQELTSRGFVESIEEDDETKFKVNYNSQ